MFNWIKKNIQSKSKFVIINLRKSKKEKNNKKEKNSRRIIDVCLLVALVIVSIYTISLAISKEYHGDAIFVNSNTKKKLPIYSVDTDKKQVAISFDAAWGEVGGWHKVAVII